jgi:hypothetical protein
VVSEPSPPFLLFFLELQHPPPCAGRPSSAPWAQCAGRRPFHLHMLLVSFPIFLASHRSKPRPNPSLLARFRVAPASFRPPAARRRRCFTTPPPCVAHLRPRPPDPRWTTQIRSRRTPLAGAPCTRGLGPPPVHGRARRQI